MVQGLLGPASGVSIPRPMLCSCEPPASLEVSGTGGPNLPSRSVRLGNVTQPLYVLPRVRVTVLRVSDAPAAVEAQWWLRKASSTRYSSV